MWLKQAIIARLHGKVEQ